MSKPTLAAVLALATLIPLALPAQAATFDVSIGTIGGGFTPATTTVAVGDSVRWTNNDPNGIVHTATSLANPVRFNTGNLGNGATSLQTFGLAGTFPYRCNLHQGMRGVVQVGANTAPSVTTTLVSGSTVSGNTIISGTVSDTEGPDLWWLIRVDGLQVHSGIPGLGIETTGGFGLSWDSVTVANGPHTVTITGSDGLASTTISIPIIVSNDLRPDFAVTEVQISNAALGAGRVQLSATVRNFGLVAGSTMVQFAYYDPDGIRHVIGAAPTGNIARSGLANIPITWDATGKIGTWKVEAVADPSATVSEPNEGNNVAQRFRDLIVAGDPIDLLDPPLP